MEGKEGIINEESINALLKFQIRRNITDLFKEFLVIFAEIQDNYKIPDSVYQKVRKKILDNGNAKIRDLEELIAILENKIKK